MQLIANHLTMYVILVTHSDHFSGSKLTDNNQRGTIPVMVGKAEPMDDHFGHDRNAWLLFLLFLPESKCICAEHDKEEQSC